MTQANPIQITFRKYPRSEALEQEIRAQIEHLQRFWTRIHGCEVVVEPEERHQSTGQRVRVGIHLHVPGRDLITGRHPARAGHEDPVLAVHDAFKAMGRQLQDYVRQHRHQVKHHDDPQTHGRVSHLEEDYGFLESFAGDQVYFHRNSLINADFEELTVGSEVRFHEEEGELGPQASTVSLVGRAAR